MRKCPGITCLGGIRRNALLLFLCCLSISLAAQGRPSTEEGLADKRILILTSYGAERPGVETLLRGFISALEVGGISVDQVFTENLDLERANDEGFRRSLSETLRRKYSKKKIDLVYVLEQPALDYLLQELAGITQGLPIIVVRANLPDQIKDSSSHFVRQLIEYDLAGTLHRAMELFPQTRRVLFIAGNPESDQEVLAKATAAMGPWKDKVAVQDTVAMTIDQVKAEIRNPPPGTIIMVLPFNRDAAGHTAVQMEIAFMVSATAGAPVFTLWQNVVGRGAVGGSVTDFADVGRQAGQFSLDLMTGRVTLTQGVTDLRSRGISQFDWGQIERWHGSFENLPKESLFINRPVTLWDRYRRPLIVTAVFLLAQTMFIALLLWERHLKNIAQMSLRESEGRFRVLVEQAPEAIIVFDQTDCRLLDVNANAERLFGASRETLLESGILPFYSKDQQDGQPPSETFMKNAELSLLNKQVIFERTIHNANGLDLLCEVRLVHLPSTGHSLIRGSFIDITERKKAEEALRLSEEKFSIIYNITPDAICLTNIDNGIMIEVNPSFEKMFGYGRKELIGNSTLLENLDLWVNREDRDRLTAKIKEFHEVHEFEAPMRRKGGIIFYAIITTTIVDLQGDNCALSICRDISDRKAAEIKICQLNEDLEQRVKERTAQFEAANKELEAFSYSVSHDLRAPLRSIDGYSQALIEDYQDRLDEDGKRSLIRIRSGTQRMGNLIDNLLKLSKTNRSELTVSDCDLSRLSSRIAGDQANLNSGRRVEVFIQPGMLVQADYNLMQVLLENLLGNALKYTSKTQDPRIEVGETVSPGGERTFFVRDNGAGFDMAHADKLFNAFQRLHETSDFEGTGIGLAIVQRVIHRHGGRIWADAKPGEGATFFFTLPESKPA